MEDSYIIANLDALCRLCLNKSTHAVSIFGAVPDDEANSLTSKIAECFQLQIDPNDGLPGRICYKCLYKVNKCSKFKLLCIQSENRLRQLTNHINELENSNSSEIINYNCSTSQEYLKPKSENYILEDSVVMVVNPRGDYHSSEDSNNVDTVEHDIAESDNTPDRDKTQESFFNNVFMCEYCDQAFVSQEQCTEHEQSFHDPSRPYKCIECSLVFAKRSQIVHHTRQLHGNDKPYHCPDCEKCFGIRSDLRKHSITHTGIRPYQCQYCLKRFSRNTNLTKHLHIHAGHKPYVCSLCPKSFVAKGGLQRHILVHSGKKPYACKRCPSTFSRKDKLIEHEVRHGPMRPEHKGDDFDKNQDASVNPFNNLMSSSTEIIIPDHISGESRFMKVQKAPISSKQLQNSPTKKAVANKNRPKNIKCHQCPMTFCSLDAYKTHVSIAHIESRVFQCKICFKKFARKRGLDRHVTVHSGMKAFSCDQGDKKCTGKDKLDKHEQTYESLVVNMPCVECGATFEKKADLLAHIKSHISDSYDVIPENEIKKEEESEYPVNEHFYDMET